MRCTTADLRMTAGFQSSASSAGPCESRTALEVHTMPTMPFYRGLLLAGVLCVWSPGCASFKQVSFPTRAPDAEQRDMKLNFAKAHEREGNFIKAEASLRELIAADPKDAGARHRLGVVLIRSGRSDEGISYLEEAVQAMPQNLDARNDLGYAYLMRGELESAESLLREALQISPNHSQSINNLALTLGYQGRTKEAYTLFRQTMSEAEAMANLGYIHSQRGEVDEAIQRYSQALTYDPTLRNAADGLIQISSVKKQALAARQEREQLAPSQTVQASFTENDAVQAPAFDAPATKAADQMFNQ